MDECLHVTAALYHAEVVQVEQFGDPSAETKVPHEPVLFLAQGWSDTPISNYGNTRVWKNKAMC